MKKSLQVTAIFILLGVLVAGIWKIEHQDGPGILAFWQLKTNRQPSVRFPASKNSQESLITASLPKKVILQFIKEQIIPNQKFIQKIHSVKMGPWNGEFVLSANWNLPGNFLDPRNDKELRSTKIDISLQMPSILQLDEKGTIMMKVVYLKIDNESYVHDYKVVKNIVAALIINSGLNSFIHQHNTKLTGEFWQDLKNLHMAKKLKYIPSKNIIGVTIDTPKLVSKLFPLFPKEQLANLKLWQFRPIQIKGSPATIFRIEIGKGIPNKSWRENQDRYEYNTNEPEAIEELLEQADLYSFVRKWLWKDQERI